MTAIEVFAEIACPFTHVELRRFVTARAERDADAPLVVRAWPLELVNDAPMSARAVAREVDALRASVAPDLFTGFRADHFPATSLPAFGLAAAAYERDTATGEAVSLALREALFEDGLDVADPTVLAAIAERFGLAPPGDARGRAKAEADWDTGRARGAEGSPHFFVGDQSWFSPSLSIEHHGHDLDVHVDEARRDEFYATALGR